MQRSPLQISSTAEPERTPVCLPHCPIHPLPLPFLRTGSLWKPYVLGRAEADVLVLYFDPKCPHCAALKPVLEALAAQAHAANRLYPRGPFAVVR